MVTLLTQLIIFGENLETLPLKEKFSFEKYENDYALLNIKGENTDYLLNLEEIIDKIYVEKDILTSKNIKELQISLIFSYQHQANAEIPTEILKKIVELNAHLNISFYQMT